MNRAQQDEAYPYPARDPAKEMDELLLGSPSHPLEIDHFLFAGQRDWTQATRILVAGGGTGDALVMMAQIFSDWGANVDIHYIDTSEASRKIAEARMAARGLTATYHTGDLFAAAELGPFDYIDCCNVLNRLPDANAAMSALANALVPGGGIGMILPAPYGRAGVPEMQHALNTLMPDDAPEKKVELTKGLLGVLPPTNGVKLNPFLRDHFGGGDAGLHDLLLRSQDRTYSVDGVYDLLEGAGLEMLSFSMPGRYNPRALIGQPELRERAGNLPPREAAALAERLCGNITTHAFYAIPKGTGAHRIAQIHGDAVPNLVGPKGAELAKAIWDEGHFTFNLDGLVVQRNLPKDVAGIVTGIDGKRSLNDIAKMMGWEAKTFIAGFKNLYQPLNNFNFLRFSARRELQEK